MLTEMLGYVLTEEQDYGIAREAAYNLSLIYVQTGATSLSKELYNRWLSI